MPWEKRLYFKDLLKSIAGEISKHNVACDTQFLDGEPSEEIVKTAKEQGIDLIIISTHHYNWLTRLAFGCDAEQILRHVSCPVLILHVHKDQLADKNQNDFRLSLDKPLIA
jgi:nucleotide-binding universal stress UspA family protein